MGPPIWLFALAILGVMAVGVLFVGRGFMDKLEARQRTARQQAQVAAEEQAEADIIKGVTSVVDPLGILF